MHLLRPDEAAYIAGLVDGEGTITLTRLHAGEGRRLVVSISNNDLELLKYVHSLVGAGKITGKRAASERHAPSFTWQLTSRQALGLLEQVASYLRTYKAIRARLALNEYLAVTPRNGKYRPDQLAKRAEFEAAFLAILPKASLTPSAASALGAHARSGAASGAG
jgi:hypothetical protein